MMSPTASSMQVIIPAVRAMTWLISSSLAIIAVTAGHKFGQGG